MLGFLNGDLNASLRSEVTALEREVNEVKETSRLMKRKAKLYEQKYASLAEIAESETTCITAESGYRKELSEQQPIRGKALAQADIAEAKSAAKLGKIAQNYRQKFREIQGDRPKFLGLF